MLQLRMRGRRKPSRPADCAVPMQERHGLQIFEDGNLNGQLYCDVTSSNVAEWKCTVLPGSVIDDAECTTYDNTVCSKNAQSQDRKMRNESRAGRPVCDDEDFCTSRRLFRRRAPPKERVNASRIPRGLYKKDDSVAESNTVTKTGTCQLNPGTVVTCPMRKTRRVPRTRATPDRKCRSTRCLTGLPVMTTTFARPRTRFPRAMRSLKIRLPVQERC